MALIKDAQLGLDGTRTILTILIIGVISGIIPRGLLNVFSSDAIGTVLQEYSSNTPTNWRQQFL